jgi:hypothetical protein
MIDLLRRAWDALDTFKQAYPENWHDENEQVLKDLIRADLSLSGVKLKWVDLTRTQIQNIYFAVLETHRGGHQMEGQLAFGEALQAAIKEKNT